MATSYKDSGVDIDKGDEFVGRIKKFVGSTYNNRVVSGVGGFAALYDIGNGKYLASGTDGVGTKLMIAQQLGVHDTIGQDLVAMCVNDVLCTGARPLFFLDYLATGKLELDVHEQLVKGIAEACLESQCVLIGGETAEMPGLYKAGEYDLAGFSVGEVMKDELICGKNLVEGDSLIGIASSGFHSNGYSLVRKMIKADERNLLEQALVPTRLYVKPVLDLIYGYGSSIKGLAHITGSGFLNIPRINEDWGYDIQWTPSYEEIPEVIGVVAKRTELDELELYRTFNMGIGFVIATDKPTEILKSLNEKGLKSWQLGHVTQKFKGIKIKNKEL